MDNIHAKGTYIIVLRLHCVLKCIPNTSIDNKSALVQVMAWQRTGDKPLPEPVMTQITNVYMRHQASMS